MTTMPPDLDQMTAVIGHGEEPGVRARRLSAMLLAYEYRRHALFDWMDAGRLQSLPGAPALTLAIAAETDPARKVAVSEAILHCYNLPYAPLSAFEVPDAALVMLPLPDCLSLLRLRALLGYASALRGWIDKPRRQLLNDWLGAPRLRWLLAQRDAFGDAGAADHLTDGVDSTTMAATLAVQGWQCFARERDWPAHSPLALTRMALPDITAPVPMNVGRGSSMQQRSSLSRNDSALLLAHLPEFFPEWSW